MRSRLSPEEAHHSSQHHSSTKHTSGMKNFFSSAFSSSGSTSSRAAVVILVTALLALVIHILSVSAAGNLASSSSSHLRKKAIPQRHVDVEVVDHPEEETESKAPSPTTSTTKKQKTTIQQTPPPTTSKTHDEKLTHPFERASNEWKKKQKATAISSSSSSSSSNSNSNPNLVNNNNNNKHPAVVVDDQQKQHQVLHRLGHTDHDDDDGTAVGEEEQDELTRRKREEAEHELAKKKRKALELKFPTQAPSPSSFAHSISGLVNRIMFGTMPPEAPPQDPPTYLRPKYYTASPHVQRDDGGYATTVVTAFYPMNKAKASTASYHRWIRNFMTIPMPLVVFTDSSTAAMIEGMRPNDHRLVVIPRPFNSWKPMQSEWRKTWNETVSKDPWASVHHGNTDLYAVWAAKPDFVLAAIAENPFRSKWFVWCDIGIMREPEELKYYANFPNYAPAMLVRSTMHVLGVVPLPDIMAQQWRDHTRRIRPDWPDVSIGGGCLAGDVTAWKDFHLAYVKTVRVMHRRGWFVGQDQRVFLTMLIERRVKHPFRIFLAPSTSSAINPWMSFPAALGGGIVLPVDERFVEDEPPLLLEEEKQQGEEKKLLKN